MSNDISDNDKDLFRASIGITQRLKPNDKAQHKKKPPKAKPLIQPQLDELDDFDFSVDVSKVASEDYLFFHRGGLQKKLIRQFRQDKLSVEAELDLHGFTTAQAEEKISTFLQSTQRAGKKIVRIIHGKGFNKHAAPPPIKNTVNRLLQQHSQVIAFCSASIHSGGTGAVNVMLKRRQDE